MDELIDIMKSILIEVQEMNMKLDNIDTSINEIKGFGLYNSISDICDKLDSTQEKLEEIKGNGLYNSISEVGYKIEEVDSSISLSNI